MLLGGESVIVWFEAEDRNISRKVNLIFHRCLGYHFREFGLIDAGRRDLGGVV